jgi:hypothetical protein
MTTRSAAAGMDEVYEFLIEFLRGIAPDVRPQHGNHNCDIWLPNVAYEFARSRGETPASPDGSYDKYFRPLHDSAWELCRIGVLRPGRAERMIVVGSSDLAEAGYSITQFGRIWLADAATRPIVDPSRLGQALGKFSSKFGRGYNQRAMEAVRTYRTNNYLAACVMSGAAAESILLALAIAKVGDEGQVLSDYKAGSGRRRIKVKILQGVGAGLVGQFEAAAQVLHYWRDDAAHGTVTASGEIEAHASLTQLLRLAQIASDYWAEFTSP